MSTQQVVIDHSANSRTNTQARKYYRYAACTRGFTVAWILMTLCFMIINIIVFIEPEWIGDTENSPGVGYVGLYQLCEFVSFGHKRVCDGAFQDFSSILTDAFRASTFFIGVSVLLIFLCVLLFLLFLCVYEVYVYIMCGILQTISTVFMFLGCVIFPRGWDHMYVRRICGDGVWRHKIGTCEMRWAYILAIVGFFDILMLAILAFVLAYRHRSKWTDIHGAKSKPVEDENDGYVVEVAPMSVAGVSAEPPRYHAALSNSSYGVAGYNPSQAGTNRDVVYDTRPRAISHGRMLSTADYGSRSMLSEGHARAPAGYGQSQYRNNNGPRDRRDSY